MDVSKYLGSTFLNVADVKVNGPIRVVIASIVEGKFEKPDLVFDDGTRLQSQRNQHADLGPRLWQGHRVLDRQGDRAQYRRDQIPGQAAGVDPHHTDLAVSREEGVGSGAENPGADQRHGRRDTILSVQRRARPV